MSLTNSITSQYLSVAIITPYLKVGDTCAKLTPTLITQLKIAATFAEVCGDIGQY
jgi:hypothetical protein